MEQFLTSVSLGFLLRSIFSGVFFVVSNEIAANGKMNLPNAGTHTIETIFIALVTGVTMYGLHRSVLYPVIEWFMSSTRAKDWREYVPLISKSTRSNIAERWQLEAGTEVGKSDLSKVQAKLFRRGQTSRIFSTFPRGLWLQVPLFM